ncbi:hypothetical protein OJAV_G00184970 [Oryzias javanicus]|uniref:Uncharacterized protein n=1 Tax=Oryzias javanicus TaxID=123683 RepID=A0A3S2U1T9_ORYJA|nr:hypothetical protein OJAV_G00184970 [Oryzias javanicus]
MGLPAASQTRLSGSWVFISLIGWEEVSCRFHQNSEEFRPSLDVEDFSHNEPGLWFHLKEHLLMDVKIKSSGVSPVQVDRDGELQVTVRSRTSGSQMD